MSPHKPPNKRGRREKERVGLRGSVWQFVNLEENFCIEFPGEPAVPNILFPQKTQSPRDGTDRQWVDQASQAVSLASCSVTVVYVLFPTSLDQGTPGTNWLSYFPSKQTGQVNFSFMRVGFLSAFSFYVFRLSSNMHNC